MTEEIARAAVSLRQGRASLTEFPSWKSHSVATCRRAAFHPLHANSSYFLGEKASFRFDLFGGKFHFIENYSDTHVVWKSRTFRDSKPITAWPVWTWGRDAASGFGPRLLCCLLASAKARAGRALPRTARLGVAGELNESTRDPARAAPAATASVPRKAFLLPRLPSRKRFATSPCRRLSCVRKITSSKKSELSVQKTVLVPLGTAARAAPANAL